MEIGNIRPVSVDKIARTPQTNKSTVAASVAAPSAADLRRELTGPLARKVLEASGIGTTDIDRYRIKLDIDDDTGRVVAEVRNKDSGELVKEVPSRTLLRQAAMLHEALGMILDKPA